MNKVILIGRLTRDPDARTTADEKPVVRYTLAVDRPTKDGQTADFIQCVAFEKRAEFAKYYLHQGSKIAVVGRLQTGSYTNKDGRKVFTTDVIVEQQEFAESKGSAQTQPPTQTPTQPSDVGEGFLDIPMDADADSLPFN